MERILAGEAAGLSAADLLLILLIYQDAVEAVMAEYPTLSALEEAVARMSGRKASLGWRGTLDTVPMATVIGSRSSLLLVSSAKAITTSRVSVRNSGARSW